MRFRKLLAASALALTLAGCGEGTPTPEPSMIVLAAGPHGGFMMPLPGESGFAEVAFEPTRTAPRGKPSSVLAAYFLGADMKTPLATPPADVKATIITPDDPAPRPVTLTAAPDKSRPDGAARFASAPGSFDYDELRGELSATVGGQPFTGTFHRR